MSSPAFKSGHGRTSHETQSSKCPLRLSFLDVSLEWSLYFPYAKDYYTAEYPYPQRFIQCILIRWRSPDLICSQIS